MGRYPGSGFESSVDECSNRCSVRERIDTDRRSCRPESRVGLTAKPPATVARTRNPRDQEEESNGLDPKEALRARRETKGGGMFEAPLGGGTRVPSSRPPNPPPPSLFCSAPEKPGRPLGRNRLSHNQKSQSRTDPPASGHTEANSLVSPTHCAEAGKPARIRSDQRTARINKNSDRQNLSARSLTSAGS
jgi:hypothetical protein